MHQAKSWIRSWIVGAGAISLLAAHAGGAMAQSTRPNSPYAAPPPVAAERGEVRGPLPAPVGHRQPKQSDLPADVIRNENRAAQDLRDLDAKLRICKGC
jgi:hypothetical protein